MTIFKRWKIAAAAIVLCASFGVGHISAAQAPAKAAASGEQTTPEAASPQADQAEQDETAQYKHSPMVKNIGKMMGMSTETAATVFEVGNFVILAALVVWFLVKTMPKVFKDRTSGIQKQLVDARSATEEASVRLTSVEDRLSHLDAQIAEMKSQAERDSVADEARIKAAVEEEAKKILAAADQEIAAAALHAQRSLQQYAAELAIEQAAKKLVISAETDRLLVQNFARQLGSDDAKGGHN